MHTSKSSESHQGKLLASHVLGPQVKHRRQWRSKALVFTESGEMPEEGCGEKER
jgi:hypothetical protein